MTQSQTHNALEEIRQEVYEIARLASDTQALVPGDETFDTDQMHKALEDIEQDANEIVRIASIAQTFGLDALDNATFNTNQHEIETAIHKLTKALEKIKSLIGDTL